MSYAQHQTLAEEITQDVFVKIFKAAGRFRGQSQISTWVYRITVNTSINYLKSKKGELRESKLIEIESIKQVKDFEHPGILLERKEDSKIFFRALNNLGENQKMAFILCFIEGLPRKKAADIMEISLKAMESLLQRAKGNLRRQLSLMYPERRKTNK